MGNFYGTSRAWIDSQLAQHHNVILEIDWQGARQIRAHFSGEPVRPKSVFILPPTLPELEQRLRSRGQDSEAVIQKRLAAAQDEMTHADEFDYVIINQDFSAALSEFNRFAEQALKPF